MAAAWGRGEWTVMEWWLLCLMAGRAEGERMEWWLVAWGAWWLVAWWLGERKPP